MGRPSRPALQGRQELARAVRPGNGWPKISKPRRGGWRHAVAPAGRVGGCGGAFPGRPGRGGCCRPCGADTCTAGWILSLLLFLFALPLHAADRVVVGSKNFEESRLLAEMFAQLLESRTHLQVERRLGLAGTQVCFEALKSGAIDVYPEYTGTGLVSILGEKAEGGPDRTLNRVRAEFLQRWNLWWLAPLGFENSWEIAVPHELAEREHL